MRFQFLLIGSCALTMVSSACDRGAPSASKNTAEVAPENAVAAPAPKATADDPDLLAVTCGDYQAALRIAQPGENPTAEAKQLAEDAQDDIIDGLLWAHGYQAAKSGLDTAPALTKAWMKTEVGRIAKACADSSPDGKMRFADAAARL